MNARLNLSASFEIDKNVGHVPCQNSVSFVDQPQMLDHNSVLTVGFGNEHKLQNEGQGLSVAGGTAQIANDFCPEGDCSALVFFKRSPLCLFRPLMLVIRGCHQLKKQAHVCSVRTPIAQVYWGSDLV